MKKILMLIAGLLYLTSMAGFANPPGLTKDVGKYPHGLEKQVKTPYGWTQGKKKGWYKNHHLHHKGNIHPINKNNIPPINKSKID